MSRAADPTAVVRKTVYDRDGGRCIACSEWDALTFQHRQAVGMGGFGRRRERPTVVEGLTACPVHNNRFEADWQLLALINGWKVRRDLPAEFGVGDVPVFYPYGGGWHLLTVEGRRLPVTNRFAWDRMGLIYGELLRAWVVKVEREVARFRVKRELTGYVG
jgi:hypothetical protein